MKRNRNLRKAARIRAAFLLLLLGCLLPGICFPRYEKIPREIEELLIQTLAEESDPARIAYVRTACGLVGRVGYFWGGKSHVIGWDPRWGWPQRVRAEGSESSGKIRRNGLDCSGFVSWAAVTAQESTDVYEQIGEGVRAQYARCRPTEQPRPGDLAFFEDLSHVGIVLGTDREGLLWVVHCSASRNGVVVTSATVGFCLYGMPGIFNTKRAP